jgi:hypothetical protein
MLGVSIVSILVGLLFVEMFWFTRKAAQAKKEGQQSDVRGEDGDRQHHYTGPRGWYTWLRPVAWVVLAALLGSLPLMVQGAFALVVFGLITGAALAVFIRGLTGRLPPVD